MQKEFPSHMVPLGDAEFQFECHNNVACFTRCCRNVNITLYPFDIIKLKNSLGMKSEEFMRLFTYLERGDNPYFPTVKLKLSMDEEKACPFLRRDGCSIYADRPSACRTYPLERAVTRSSQGKIPEEYYFLTNHAYCLGHREKKKHTAIGWIRNQQVYEYNVFNDYWATVDTLFASNPWKGEGDGGEKQRLAFLVCYNIDSFRQLVVENRILQQFSLEKSQRRRIESQDGELLKFGFEWLKLVLTGRSSLVRK